MPGIECKERLAKTIDDLQKNKAGVIPDPLRYFNDGAKNAFLWCQCCGQAAVVMPSSFVMLEPKFIPEEQARLILRTAMVLAGKCYRDGFAAAAELADKSSPWSIKEMLRSVLNNKSIWEGVRERIAQEVKSMDLNACEEANEPRRVGG